MHDSDSESSVSPEFPSFSCGRSPYCFSFRSSRSASCFSLEMLKLRWVNLLQYPFCSQVSPKLRPRTFRCNRIFINASRDLSTILSSFCSWIISVIVTQLIKMKFLVQRRELKLLTLKKWRRLIHSSRVKLPSVRMCDEFWFGGPNWFMPHHGTATFDNHLNHGLVVFKDVQHDINIRMYVLDEMWSMFVGTTLVCLHWMRLCMFDLVACNGLPRSFSLGCLILLEAEWNTSIIKSQRVRAGIPSMRKPASREIISTSVQLCETDVCFLHRLRSSGSSSASARLRGAPRDDHLSATRQTLRGVTFRGLHPLPATPFQCARAGRAQHSLPLYCAVSSLFQQRSTTGQWPSR